MTRRLDRIPKKVYDKALELGADIACLETNDPELADPQCLATIYLAYDHFYGDLPDEASMMMAIRNDLLTELDAERAQ